MKNFSERRLKENEVIFRAANRAMKNYSKASSPKGAEEALEFYCECSRLNCAKRIEMTGKQFEKVHKSKNHFMVLPGHEIPEIEKVTDAKEGFFVVQKHGEVPELGEINLKLKPQEI